MEAVTSFTGGNEARFEFGENWTRFLQFIDDPRIEAAKDSLASNLGDLNRKSFLDAGSGSGLFSLAARRLGAQVHSVEFDTKAVACTRELKRRYSPEDPDWVIERGDVLDKAYLATLGQFDVVYSWGVLHHTGSMWEAIENVGRLVKPGGLLFISIGNDQGGASRRWTWVKRTYNHSGPVVRWLLVSGAGAYFEGTRILVRLRDRQNPFARPEGTRGMIFKTNLIDWVGGWPFQVATADAVFGFCKARGFSLEKLRMDRGHGCNEFVFQNR